MASDHAQPADVRVRLFARARDLAGTDAVVIALPEGATVGDLRKALAARYPALAGLLDRSALAVDDEFARDAQPLPARAEVALLPPVSGGQTRSAPAPLRRGPRRSADSAAPQSFPEASSA